MTIASIDVVKVLLPSTIAFVIGILGTPLLTNFLYKHRMWKKSSVSRAVDGKATPITARLNNDAERRTPRMGGIVIWMSVLLATTCLAALAQLFPVTLFAKLDILSRSQTWLPLFTLVAGAICGLFDDYLVCRESGSYAGGGLSLRARLLFVFGLGCIGAYWFFAKLGMSALNVPFYGQLELGYFFFPVFIIFFIGMYSGGIIDGVDGLSGGVFASIFSAYAIITFVQGQIDLAAFSAAIVGGLLAFLWFNIPPARFFASETGTMGLTTTLVVVAFLADQVIVLPVIAFLLVITSASSLIQVLSKRLRKGKKVFLVAPLHNHFQALGWPPYKVTMRYWVLSAMFALIGIILALVG
jgi:phospho-N-acetylmuramoyl-pentapeptide-transferase